MWITEITVEGTVEDWQNLFIKCDGLTKYQLDWWISKVKPIIKEIIETKKGNFRKEFWMNMIRIHTPTEYGEVEYIDGWIVKFFPYDRFGRIASLNRIESAGDYPDEVVKVPFKMDFVDPNLKPFKSFQCEFWSGFMGLEQNPKNF